MWTNEADLSGISGVPSQISAYKLIQDSYIKFDEKGIQGAAGIITLFSFYILKNVELSRSVT